MNKKGFTLIELLAVIVILSLVMTIGFYSINGINNAIKKSMTETKIKNLETTAMKYGQDHQNETDFFEECYIDDTHYNFCKTVTVEELVENNYFETEETDKNGNKIVTNNSTNESMMDKKITIYKNNNRIYAIFGSSSKDKEDYLNK